MVFHQEWNSSLRCREMGGGIFGVLLSFDCHDDYKMLLELRGQAPRHPEVCALVLHDVLLSCPKC